MAITYSEALRIVCEVVALYEEGEVADGINYDIILNTLCTYPCRLVFLL